MSALTLHDLAGSSRPVVGIECNHCMHRALLGGAELQAQRGDKRTLAEAGVHCEQCRSRKFSATRFQSRSAVHSFMRNV
jgi:DNA-directed RNA polymerase subunit RPC12/RpoP